MTRYIHYKENWTDFVWDDSCLISLLSEVRHLQGRLIGKVELLGFELQGQANLETLIFDVLHSSEIEGEILDEEQVRSSIAVKLGLEQSGLVHIPRDVDGVVEMMLNATQTENKELDADRLFGWHNCLFPAGRSGMYKIEVGQWRTGEMEVVSGAMGHERVHFRAPSADRLAVEMQDFFNWFNGSQPIDPILKAAIAHLWFVTIHPFDDGNGRIARAITDMQLSKADGVNQRFYSMSTEIQQQRKAYYQILEKTQKGGQDITDWIFWFLSCLKQAILNSSAAIAQVILKHKFWQKHKLTVINDRQHKMLTKLLTAFKGKLSSSKWAKMTKVSQDTAQRDIKDLIEKGVLIKADSSGRSTHYWLNLEGL